MLNPTSAHYYHYCLICSSNNEPIFVQLQLQQIQPILALSCFHMCSRVGFLYHKLIRYQNL